MTEPIKTLVVELDQNGIKKNMEVRRNALRTVGDIFKELRINEETALIFFKNEPIPSDEPIDSFENIDAGDFRILKVIFDE
jgi:hypothetical protein